MKKYLVAGLAAIAVIASLARPAKSQTSIWSFRYIASIDTAQALVGAGPYYQSGGLQLYFVPHAVPQGRVVLPGSGDASGGYNGFYASVNPATRFVLEAKIRGSALADQFRPEVIQLHIEPKDGNNAPTPDTLRVIVFKANGDSTSLSFNWTTYVSNGVLCNGDKIIYGQGIDSTLTYTRGASVFKNRLIETGLGNRGN